MGRAGVWVAVAVAVPAAGVLLGLGLSWKRHWRWPAALRRQPARQGLAELVADKAPVGLHAVGLHAELSRKQLLELCCEPEGSPVQQQLLELVDKILSDEQITSLASPSAGSGVKQKNNENCDENGRQGAPASDRRRRLPAANSDRRLPLQPLPNAPTPRAQQPQGQQLRPKQHGSTPSLPHRTGKAAAAAARAAEVGDAGAVRGEEATAPLCVFDLMHDYELPIFDQQLEGLEALSRCSSPAGSARLRSGSSDEADDPPAPAASSLSLFREALAANQLAAASAGDDAQACADRERRGRGNHAESAAAPEPPSCEGSVRRGGTAVVHEACGSVHVRVAALEAAERSAAAAASPATPQLAASDSPGAATSSAPENASPFLPGDGNGCRRYLPDRIVPHHQTPFVDRLERVLARGEPQAGLCTSC